MRTHRVQSAAPTARLQPSNGMLALILAVLAMTLSLWGARAEASVSAQDGDGWVTREVEGVGASLVQAKADAIRAALRQVVGEFVRSEVVVERDTVDEVLIAFSSPEQVRSEQIGSPSLRSDGMVVVQMRVSVMARSLVRAFEVYATRSGGRVTRTATASAPSLQAARAAAISDALRAIVGEFVEAKLTSDGVIVEDVIRSFSTGASVQSEQVGEAALTPSGDIRVTMRVSLRPQELIDMFAEQAQGDILLDAENLAAEIEVARSSFQAQRALMQRLFTDLPIRLLVARLIDRDGRPIVDGRPDPRDIRPLDDDNIAIAFNVEIYFDLPSYYGKVLPNLVTALRAVSSEEANAESTFRALEDGMNGYVTGQSDPRNPTALRLWGSRAPVFNWLWELFHNASRGRTLSPQERVVAFSIGRNRDGSSEQWGLWRCPDWIAETVHTAASSVLDVNIALSLLDGERRVVALTGYSVRELRPLLIAKPSHRDGGIYPPGRSLDWDGAASAFRFVWRRPHPAGLFEMNGVLPGREVQPWFMNQWGIEAPWSRPMTFCSPRFVASFSGGGTSLIDVVPIRVALVLPQSDFERVRSVAFDFFTDEHLGAASE